MAKQKPAIVGANRKTSADMAMKGMQASLNPAPIKPLGKTPGAPAKNAPPKLTGAASGGKVKLGNH